jgi:ribosomal protein S27AE
MYTADNAVITGYEGDDGNCVKFRPRCPNCGQVDNSYYGERIRALNKKGETVDSNNRCPKCGTYFMIHFYGF